MKISFVQNTGVAAFGIMYLSAVLKEQGHDCEVIHVVVEKDWMKAVARSKPDAVAFSATSSENKWLSNTTQVVKEMLDVPVVVGGPHPTFYPHIIQEDRNMDAICVGEGEEAAVELFGRWESGKDETAVKNMWVRKGGKIHRNPPRNLNEDLDSIPFPDRKIYYDKYDFMRKSSVKRFLAGRGCPYDCSYCHNHAMKEIYKGKGRYVRRRSVENVIEELKEVEKKYGMKRLTFSDDTFIIDRKWLEEFLAEYKKEVGIPFLCNVRANLVDEDLIKRLKDANCLAVAMGVEAGNECIRTRILNKHVTTKQIVDAARLFKKHGIKLKAFNLICVPDETIKEAWETVKLNAEIKADIASFAILQPYPGLSITDYAISKGYLPKDFGIEELDEWGQSHAVIRSKDERELENLSALGLLCIKHPRLVPIVKQLIKLPPNKMFKLLANAVWGYHIMKTFEIGAPEAINFFLKSNHRVQ